MSSKYKYPVGTKENVAVVALLDDSINGKVTGIVPSTVGWTREEQTKLHPYPELSVSPYTLF